MSTEPPSLPYARDEASTSQHLSAYPAFQDSQSIYASQTFGQAGGPSSPDDADTYDEALDDLGELDEVGGSGEGAALQYWAAKRHMGPVPNIKGEDEYGESPSRLSVVSVPEVHVCPATKELTRTVVGWRLKSRMKTFNAGLFICLNIGVDPPDVVKTNPCAKLECWLDPSALPSTKAIEAIGRSESSSSTPQDIDG